MEQLEETDLFNVIKKALIIITPEGEVITVKDDNQKYHRQLFAQTRNAIIQEVSKKGINGRIKSQILSQNGHTVLIGDKASSSQGEGYYYKILNLPSEWKKDKDAKDKFIFLLKTFERIPQEIIDKGFALEIRINMPDGQYSEIYYPNEVFKSSKFNADEAYLLIKKIQEQLNQDNSRKPGGFSL